MMAQLLASRRILVTGANRGIGWATCQVLAANGAHVVAASRSTSDEFKLRLEALRQERGVPVEQVQLELADQDSIKQVILGLRKSETPLYGLVNNAGVTYNALLQMSRVESARDLFEANVFGLLSLMQGCVKLMARQRKGAIVNVASTAAFDGNCGKAVYGASKAAVVTISKSAARELGASGIRINTVAPGLTDTDMLGSMSDEVIAEAEASTDLGRRGQPTEIAEAICFLLSDLSSYVNGQVLRVDGGMRA